MVQNAEGCGGEESTGARTPTLGVCCYERASQRGAVCRGLQAEEKDAKAAEKRAAQELLKNQKVRTPRL